MSSDLTFWLKMAEGPLFRCAFALLVLGVLRQAMLALSSVSAGYVTETRADFRRKLIQRLVWLCFPSVLLRSYFRGRPAMFLYHVVLSTLSLVFRLGAVIIPAFMVAHVHLWERALGISWPSIPQSTADAITLITIAAGLVFFWGRLYSPLLRAMEPAWAFFKPLILILPFITGYLAMHPTLSPLPYNAMLLLHVLSGCVVLVMIPFGRMLNFLHTPLIRYIPQAAWKAPVQADQTLPAQAKAVTA